MGKPRTPLAHRPILSHLWRTVDRYFTRLGNQLAASIAFITITAFVPLVMFAFAGLGFTLTVIRPEWLGVAERMIRENVTAGPVQDQFITLVTQFLYNWRSVGLVALGISLFIGSSWVGNLKACIRGMVRPDSNAIQARHNPVVEFFINMGQVFILILLAAGTFITTTIGTQLVSAITGWLKVSNVHVSDGLVRGASLLLSLMAATTQFYLIYRFFPERPLHRVAVRRGALGTGIIFVILQAAAGLLTRFFAMGKSAQVLGPVIVVMIIINLVAQVTMWGAAWIATYNQPGVARRYASADVILREHPDTITARYHWQAADEDYRRIQTIREQKRRERMEMREKIAARVETAVTTVEHTVDHTLKDVEDPNL